jgi:hypothetical protein
MLEEKKRYAKIARRVRSYRWIDGLSDIELGFNELLLGLAFLFQALPNPVFLPGTSTPNPNYLLHTIAMPLIMISAVIFNYLTPHLHEWLQKKFTFPRTGYVDYKPKVVRSRKRTVYLLGLTTLGMVGIIVVAVIFTFVYRGVPLLTYMLFMASLLIGIIFFWSGFANALPRSYFMGVLCIGLGFSLGFCSMLNLERDSFDRFVLAVYFVGFGWAEIVLGGLVFRKYLKNNPLPVTSEHGQLG